MTISELKAQVEYYRTDLITKKKGLAVKFSEYGPVGMTVIDAIVKTLETQQAKIEELESKLNSLQA